jgi:hypothetical protein
MRALGFPKLTRDPLARTHHRRQRHTRCPLCHQHTRCRRPRTQTALSTGYSASEPSPSGRVNGADSAEPGIKASPAVTTAAPPSRNVNIPRRSIVVILFLPTNIDLRTIALLAAKSTAVQGAGFDEARPHLGRTHCSNMALGCRDSLQSAPAFPPIME